MTVKQLKQKKPTEFKQESYCKFNITNFTNQIILLTVGTSGDLKNASAAWRLNIWELFLSL